MVIWGVRFNDLLKEKKRQNNYSILYYYYFLKETSQVGHAVQYDEGPLHGQLNCLKIQINLNHRFQKWLYLIIKSPNFNLWWSTHLCVPHILCMRSKPIGFSHSYHLGRPIHLLIWLEKPTTLIWSNSHLIKNTRDIIRCNIVTILINPMLMQSFELIERSKNSYDTQNPTN